jgi:glutamine synthetase type III
MCVCVATRCFFVVDCTSSIFIVAGNRGVTLEVPRTTIPRQEKGASKRLEVSRPRSAGFGCV